MLALLLEDEGFSLAAEPSIIPRRGGDNPVLSFAQERLWFLHQLEPNSAYNIPDAFRLRGRLNIAALEQSLNDLVRRHEVLRTGFEMINGRPVQTVSELTVPLPVIDLQHLPAEERESQAIHLMTDAAKQPFDLSQDAVLRAVLYQLSATDYILLLITHHIASDGWSAGILFQELAAFYESHTSNSPLTLPPLPIQYADFAAWQREWFDSDALADQLAYWQSQLGPDLTTLNLPTDYPRPTKQTFQGARHAIQLSPQLSQRLLAFSRQEGVTLFMTLLAAFKVLLHRYTGQAEIVVGSPIANRNRRELEALVGFFANTLVLKSGIEPNQTFRQYLAQVRDVALAAYDHQDVPFEKLVEVLQPERDLSRNPLFQVMFILQNTPAEPVSLPGVSFTPLDVDNGTAKFDLTLAMVETDGGLRAKFEYNTALFESTTIARLAEHFQTLLVRLLDQPDQRLAEVDYLTEAEQQQLLSDWNDTHRPYPENETVVQLFERQVEQSPAGVAVIFPAGDRGKAQQLTYREINSRANQLAHHLKALKVGPGELVGVSMARSVDMIVGILAVLKTGAAYVPLDPAYPRQRLEFMLADSQASVVLTQSEVEANLSAYEGHLIRLDRDWPRIVGQSTANLEVTIKADDPAYVIYTSGSTGTPKGVLGLHRGAVNRFRWMWETYPFAADERCCQKTTLNFVDSVWEIFGPLLQGIPTVLIPDERVKDPDQLVQTLADYQVSRLVLVPSLLRAILDSHPNLQAKLPHLKI
ncbi:MAG: condensation domain-containing protein, partial [Anaerolineae bacterium]|nr:condensation domain-containing protein [Anaerolineae bacterium]